MRAWASSIGLALAWLLLVLAVIPIVPSLRVAGQAPLTTIAARSAGQAASRDVGSFASNFLISALAVAGGATLSGVFLPPVVRSRWAKKLSRYDANVTDFPRFRSKWFMPLVLAVSVFLTLVGGFVALMRFGPGRSWGVLLILLGLSVLFTWLAANTTIWVSRHFRRLWRGV